MPGAVFSARTAWDRTQNLLSTRLDTLARRGIEIAAEKATAAPPKTKNRKNGSKAAKAEPGSINGKKATAPAIPRTKAKASG